MTMIQEKRKTSISGLILFSFFAAICVLFAADQLIEKKYGGTPHGTDAERHIRLREHKISQNGTNFPSMDGIDGLELKEYKFRTDKNGFIEPSLEHKNADITIAFLGGSTTECMYVTEDKRFPYLSTQFLEKSTGASINSINSGVGGNNSLHSIDILVNKIIPFNPDVVVMMHAINDISTLLLEKTYWNDNPSLSPIQNPTRAQTPGVAVAAGQLAKTLLPNLSSYIDRKTKKPAPRDPFEHIRGKKISLDRDRMLRDFRANLRTFIFICRARGIEPVLMTQANRFTKPPDPAMAKKLEPITRDYGIPYDEITKTIDAFNQAIIEEGSLNGATVIDLAGTIPQNRDYIYDLVHYNDDGSSMAAEIISKGLEPVVKSLLNDKKR